MTAYWLTFKPLAPDAPIGWPIEHLKDLVARFDADPTTATEWWRIAAHRSAQVGERVYLFKQGEGLRGIFGVGTIVGGPERRSTRTDAILQFHVEVRFEKLVDPSERFLLRLDEIEDIVPKTAIDAQASGTRIEGAVAAELESRLAPRRTPPIGADEADDATLDPESTADERQRALRAIRIRRGQSEFRAQLLDAYGGRCAVTGCAVKDVLEAAHISPYRGPLTNHVSNGLLLRADVHTLFDCYLFSICPSTRQLAIAPALEVSAYGKFAGRTLRCPQSETNGPSTKNLQRHFSAFEALWKRDT